MAGGSPPSSTAAAAAAGGGGGAAAAAAPAAPATTPAGAHAGAVALGVPEKKVLRQQEWFVCPEWAAPPRPGVHLEVVKGGLLQDRLMIDSSPYYMLGRDAAAVDLPVEHASTSGHHCVVVHHRSGSVYIVDLASKHGSYVNGTRIPSKQTTKFSESDELRIGQSTRLYKLRRNAPQKEAKVIQKRPSTVGAGGAAPAPPAKVPRAAPDSAPSGAGKLCVRHVLLKHTGSRKLRSWRDPSADVTRTKDDAVRELAELRAKLLAAGAGLADAVAAAAAQVSDCNSAKKGGDLGSLQPGKMLQEFEDAAAALEVGGLSEPVCTDSGVHLILRTA